MNCMDDSQLKMIWFNCKGSGLLSSNDTTLECSFNKAEGEDVLTLFFSYKNKTSQIYENIVIFTSTTEPRFTANGQYLSDRIDLLNQTLTSSPAKIIFSDLKCTDDASYKCNITYQIRRTFKQHTVESHATQITVRVLPEKPQLTAFVNRSVISTPTSTATTTSMNTNTSLVIMEGDNITFVCSGNVGKPPGSFVFQMFRPGYILTNNYTNVITHTTTKDEMCFFLGISSLSIPIMSEDNQTIVRCIVDSSSADENLYEDSPTIEVVLQLIAVTAAAGVAFFLILLVGIRVLYKKRQQNIETNSEDNRQKEDTYAISQDGLYDKPGDRRHKHENNCEHYDVSNVISDSNNKPIASKDSNMLKCYPTPPGKSKSGGYESVVIDGDNPVLSTESNGCDCHAVEIVKQHNEKYMHSQKKDEETINTSPISPQPVEYAQVNEAKNDDMDKQTVNTSTERQERIKVESEERHKKKGENVDNTNTSKSSANSEYKKQRDNITAKIQQGNNDGSTRTVDNDENFDTTKYLRKQQTHGGRETSKRNDQTHTYTNQAYETDRNQSANEVSSQFRLFDGPNDDGERNHNAD
ncbi:unnamed protein product [Mytilus coruscus]|uniref:Ig-like domain-containing protein n=1 Tax=Mytilus coruscus TaxID=42192 RepID=A0A6J8ABN2_MYTCO|nr:unnamed protein product [Mytilus coruscus]